MNKESHCLIWGTPAPVKSLDIEFLKIIDSPRAGGRYSISEQAITLLPQIDDRVKARLTTWLVDQRRLGNECPEIDTNTLKTEGKQGRDLPIYIRAEKLLTYFTRESRWVGDHLNISNNNFFLNSMAWSGSIDAEELAFFSEYLEEKGWIKGKLGSAVGGGVVGVVQISVEGYSHISDITSKQDSAKCFVAMWFHDSTNKAWEQGIKLGIEDAGYEAVRIDQKEHVNKIDDEIIAEIRRSRFVVADFTQGEKGARGGVYYEAGFAHGLGIEVIFTCRKDVLDNDDIHFDTRQYNHIDWETPEELRQRLADRISAVIGDGPYKENGGH